MLRSTNCEGYGQNCVSKLTNLAKVGLDKVIIAQTFYSSWLTDESDKIKWMTFIFKECPHLRL